MGVYAHAIEISVDIGLMKMCWTSRSLSSLSLSLCIFFPFFVHTSPPQSARHSRSHLNFSLGKPKKKRFHRQGGVSFVVLLAEWSSKLETVQQNWFSRAPLFTLGFGLDERGGWKNTKYREVEGWSRGRGKYCERCSRCKRKKKKKEKPRWTRRRKERISRDKKKGSPLWCYLGLLFGGFCGGI